MATDGSLLMIATGTFGSNNLAVDCKTLQDTSKPAKVYSKGGNFR
jgi:hypothetical protein